MKPKTKLMAMIVLLAAAIGGSAMLYRSLSGQYHPSDPTQFAYQTPSGGTGSAKNMKAPDFTMFDGMGKSIKLSDLQGKPIVLNFWASWCPPCRAEMPEFDRLSREFSGDITFLMVNMTDGSRETVEKAKSYTAGQNFTFPVYYDTKQEAAAAYGVSALPTTIFIGKDGSIASASRGAMDEAALRNSIAKIHPIRK